jgi:hypothetical protein
MRSFIGDLKFVLERLQNLELVCLYLLEQPDHLGHINIKEIERFRKLKPDLLLAEWLQAMNSISLNKRDQQQ